MYFITTKSCLLFAVFRKMLSSILFLLIITRPVKYLCVNLVILFRKKKKKMLRMYKNNLLIFFITLMHYFIHCGFRVLNLSSSRYYNVHHSSVVKKNTHKTIFPSFKQSVKNSKQR